MRIHKNLDRGICNILTRMPRIGIHKKPKIYEGTCNLLDEMPKWKIEGRTPLSVAELMQRRLEVRNTPYENNHFLTNNYDTIDAVAYHPRGKVKIVRNSQHIKDLNPESVLMDRALLLHDGEYEALPGQEFTRAELNGYLEVYQSETEAIANLVWKTVVGDQELLNDYVKYIFGANRKIFSCHGTMMHVHLDSETESVADFPHLRNLTLEGLQHITPKSNLLSYNLDNGGYNRLAE